MNAAWSFSPSELPILMGLFTPLHFCTRPQLLIRG